MTFRFHRAGGWRKTAVAGRFAVKKTIIYRDITKMIPLWHKFGGECMQEEYTGTLLEDGHISIPQEIIENLKIDKGSKLRVIVQVEKGISKNKILSYAGILSDLTGEEQKRFDETTMRRSFFGNRKAEI